MGRRVLISGGAGLIGRALAQRLVEAGEEVIVLSRQPEKASDLPSGVALELWDGATGEGWEQLVDGAKAVVNLAGENIAKGKWTAERKLRIRESRMNAGRALVEAIEAASHRPQVLVQASGVGYYGDCGDQLLTEASEAGKDFLAKLAVEWEAGTEPVEAIGVRRVVIRTGVVLSTEGGALTHMILPFRYFVGGKIGGGRQWFPWIHIADEVEAIRFLIERGDVEGVFNLTAPNPITNSDFGHMLGRQLSKPSLLPVPSILLRLVFGEMADVLLFSQRAVPERLTKSGYVFRFADAPSALRDLLSSD